MTTISELQQLGLDLEYRVGIELKAVENDERNISALVVNVRTAIENVGDRLADLDAALKDMFAARTDALMATMGTPPTTGANEE